MDEHLTVITDDGSTGPWKRASTDLSGDNGSASGLGTTSVWSSLKRNEGPTFDSQDREYQPGEPYAENNAIFPVERLYPQFFDRSVDAGQVRVLIQSAIEDARGLLLAFGAADLDGVGSGLATIASLMKQAHKLTSFNEDFGAVVSFIRRATLFADRGDVTRESLNVLLSVLINLGINPAIDLGEAADAIDQLSSVGWQGQDAALAEIYKFLFEGLDDVVAEAVQVELPLGAGSVS